VASAYAGVSLWTPPSGFAVGFNEPWVGDYKCDYYSAWLSGNSYFSMKQGVPDTTNVLSGFCNDSFEHNRQVLCLTSLPPNSGSCLPPNPGTGDQPKLPYQMVYPSGDYLPNSSLWGIKKANAGIVKILLFSNLQGLDTGGTTFRSAAIPIPTGITDEFATNLKAFLLQAQAAQLKVYLTVLNGGDLKSWANVPLGPDKKPYLQTYFQRLISDNTTKNAFMTGILRPLFDILESPTYRPAIYAVDLINEIEAPLNAGSVYFPTGWMGARTWIAEMVGYIKSLEANVYHTSTPIPLTAPAGYGYAVQEITSGLFSGLGLDFFDLHVYKDNGQYSGQSALCNKVTGDRQQIILGEYGQSSTTKDDDIQNRTTEAFLYGAAHSCFKGALAWKFEGTSNDQLGYRTVASGPQPPYAAQEPPLGPRSPQPALGVTSYPYRKAYCAIKDCGASPPSSHGSNCGFNSADYTQLCEVVKSLSSGW
jgi:hypothetical protein